MIDLILAGLIAGVVVFLIFFFASFVILGLAAGVYHLLVSAYGALLESRASRYHEQTA